MALEFAAGCLGGAAGVVAGHPLDTIKVKLQTQDGARPQYRGTWHCFRSTLKAESVRGLYKGVSSPLVGVSFVNAVVFGVHGNALKMLKEKDSVSSQATAGACAGFVQSFVACPLELAKTRVQIQTPTHPLPGSRPPPGPLQCARDILRQEGARGLFRGQFVTVVREVPGFAAYFASYDFLLKRLSGDDAHVSPAAILVSGGVAGIMSWVVTYPVDVVKSRLQADGAGGARRYRGAWHCLQDSVAREGASVLARGLAPTVIRAFPTNAATFAVVSCVMSLAEGDERPEVDSCLWEDVLELGEAIVAAAPPLQDRLGPIFVRQTAFVSSVRKTVKIDQALQ